LICRRCFDQVVVGKSPAASGHETPGAWGKIERMIMVDASEYTDDEQLEARAVARTFELIAVAGDPMAAKTRLQEIVDATAELAKQRVAAEITTAEAYNKRTAAEALDADVTKRVANHQQWVDATERSYREREARILENERIWGERNAALEARETDLASRVAAHESLVRKLKEFAA
jgi:hypothetical protein